MNSENSASPRPAPPVVKAGSNCWRIVKADRATLIVDVEIYYHVIREAFEAAERSILIIGWDFDTRIQLEHAPSGGRSKPESLGRFFLRLARKNPDRRIDILKWSFGAKKQLLHLRSAWMLARWYVTRAIDFRFDAAHPPGCSHHQKVVVIDEELAVCGGIDIGLARWDTREHLDDDPGRALPSGKPYGPWHDVTMMTSGEIAGALAEIGRERWKLATSKPLSPVKAATKPHWPEDLPVQFENVSIAISRTRAEYKDASEIREVEQLHLDIIQSAQSFIYIENQYLTSGKVAAAIAERMQRPDPPEIVVVMPRTADGWLEQRAMDAARVLLTREIAKSDPANRFRIYVPVTRGGTDIYVHAKVTIVDDRILRVGSSNLNNRSLGFDSECDLTIDAALPGNEAVPLTIANIRNDLIAEHLDVTPERFAQEFANRGSLIDAIEALRSDGKTLDLLELEDPGEIDEFIAQYELLDPESADKFVEPISQRGLRKSWNNGRRMLRR